MSNNLPAEKQRKVIAALTDGCSIRATERMTETHRDTIMRLARRVGDGCAYLMDERMRNLPCQNVQIDEIWTFVYKKQRHVKEQDNRSAVGDFWVYVALDADSKIVPSYRVGKRDLITTRNFLDDLASRLKNRVQLSSDELQFYADGVKRSFGENVDYGTIVKSYESEPIGPGRYSPPKVVGTHKTEKIGNPCPELISTSYVERQNLTMRTNIRRLTRLSSGFSKKFENLRAAISLHFANYNFCRIHGTLGTTPAVAAGVASEPWTIDRLLAEVN